MNTMRYIYCVLYDTPMTFLVASILSSRISTAKRCKKSPTSWNMSINLWKVNRFGLFSLIDNKSGFEFVIYFLLLFKFAFIQICFYLNMLFEFLYFCIFLLFIVNVNKAKGNIEVVQNKKAQISNNLTRPNVSH